MLFSIVKYISANDLNHDLDIINNWAHQWKLESNLSFEKHLSEKIKKAK